MLLVLDASCIGRAAGLLKDRTAARCALSRMTPAPRRVERRGIDVWFDRPRIHRRHEISDVNDVTSRSACGSITVEPLGQPIDAGSQIADL